MTSSVITVRQESRHDRAAVFTLNASSFSTDAEAKLVEALRTEVRDAISLVAEIDGKIVGHILFTPVTLAEFPDANLMGLAPMAVTASKRKQGVGAKLIEEGLQACRAAGAGAIVVLGHPDYYPRFGFRKASDFNISCEYDVPDEVFMTIELKPAFFAGKHGVVKYHPLFSSV